MPFEAITIPEDYICSITDELMVDPVFTSDGETYERTAIADWLQTHNTSPNTNEELEGKQLVPNRKLKSQISEFVEKNRRAFENELLQAVQRGELKVVEHILKLGIAVNAKDVHGYTALYYAVQQGRIEIARLLINNNINYKEPMALPVEIVKTVSHYELEQQREQLRKQIKVHAEQLRKLEQAAEKEQPLKVQLHTEIHNQIKRQLAEMQTHAKMITNHENQKWIIKKINVYNQNGEISIYLPAQIDTSYTDKRASELHSQLHGAGSTKAKLSAQEIQELEQQLLQLQQEHSYLSSRYNYCDLADLVQEFKDTCCLFNGKQNAVLDDLRQRILELSKPNLAATQALVNKLSAQLKAFEATPFNNLNLLQAQQKLAALRQQESDLEKALQQQQNEQQRKQDEASRPLREKQAKLEEVKQKKAALEQKLVYAQSYLEGLQRKIKEFRSQREQNRWNWINILESKRSYLMGLEKNYTRNSRIDQINGHIYGLNHYDIWQLYRVFIEINIQQTKDEIEDNPNGYHEHRREQIKTYERQRNELPSDQQQVNICHAQIPFIQAHINQLETEIQSKPYQAEIEALTAEIQQLQQPKWVQPLQNVQRHTTALHLAVTHDHKDMIDLLLAKGMSVDSIDSEGQTALHCAVKLNKPEFVKLLLEQKAAINSQDNHGNTALHIAVQQNNEAFIELLLELGANPSIKNQQGLKPLDLDCKAILAAKLEALKDKQLQSMQSQIHTLQQQLQQLSLHMQQLLAQQSGPVASSAVIANPQVLPNEPISLNTYYSSQPSDAASSQQSAKAKFFKPAANESKLDQELNALSEQVKTKREAGNDQEALKLSKQIVDRLRQEIERSNDRLHKNKLYNKIALADYEHACLLQEAGRIKDALFYLGKAEEICKRSDSLEVLSQQIAQKLEDCRNASQKGGASQLVTRR